MSSRLTPDIGPPPSAAARPFWSVMIPVYNRTRFLDRTLSSVLEQDPGADKMQIEVVDDASELGNAESRVRRIGGDRVKFYRQLRNLGVPGNWNVCVERAVGQWVHVLHSDDFVLPGFYQRLKSVLETRDDIGAAFCRHSYVDESEVQCGLSPLESSISGILPNFIEAIGISQKIQCAAIVVRRTVYENLGGYRLDLRYTPDWEMWTRIAAKYPIWYTPETLAAYRIHSESYTDQLTRMGQLVPDMRHCIEACHSYLPQSRAGFITRKAKERTALWALDRAGDAIREGRVAATFGYVVEGMRTSSSPRVLIRLAAESFRLAWGGIRRASRLVQRKWAGCST